MSNGAPLTDADRWAWLDLLREESLRALTTSSGGTYGSGVIVTCSALKRSYRDIFRKILSSNPTVKVHFIFLSARKDLLVDRVRARRNHYMKEHMVETQIECLEMPQGDEVDVVSVDTFGTTREVQEIVVAVVKQMLLC